MEGPADQSIAGQNTAQQDGGVNGSAALGAAVRAARTRLDLSVQALAQRAGVSLGLVSQVERGRANPSLQSIQRIAQALGVSASRLLEPPSDQLTVVPAGQRHTLSDEDISDAEQPLRELLSPPGDTRIQLIRTVLQAGFSNEHQPFRHIGTESITVLSGTLLLAHGQRREHLGPGDSATYGCSTPHWWANKTPTETVVLGAFTPLEH